MKSLKEIIKGLNEETRYSFDPDEIEIKWDEDRDFKWFIGSSNTKPTIDEIQRFLKTKGFEGFDFDIWFDKCPVSAGGKEGYGEWVLEGSLRKIKDIKEEKTSGMSTETKEKIDSMSHYEMAKLIRFSPIGHPYFSDKETYDYFMKKFNSLGGMTSTISKSVGLDENTDISDLHPTEVFDMIRSNDLSIEEFDEWLEDFAQLKYNDGYESGYDSGFSMGYGDRD